MSPLSIPEFAAAVGVMLPGADAADSARRVPRMFPQLLANPLLPDPAQRADRDEDYDRGQRRLVPTRVTEYRQGEVSSIDRRDALVEEIP